MTAPADGGGWRLLLTTNGARAGLPALEQGVWLAGRLSAEVRVLGIAESGRSQARVEATVEKTGQELFGLGLRYTLQVQPGESTRVIAREADRDGFLTVVGPLGHPALERWIRGRSVRRMMEAISSPMIYCRSAPRRLGRMLICLGGLGYAFEAEALGLRLARHFGSSVTLLHVVEPVGYDYPTARAVQNRWQDILETDTPQGKNLRRAMELAEGAGVSPDFQVRHGVVVHEVLTEVRTKGYDLIVMGSAYSAQALRRLFLTNVTAGVAESVLCPVLTVRSAYSSPQT